MDDEEFELNNLRITVTGDPVGYVCSHVEGQYIDIVGENMIFTGSDKFSFYTFSSVLPLLAATQRITNPNDWMSSDDLISCPDPNCSAKLEISITGKTKFKRSETTVTPKPDKKS